MNNNWRVLDRIEHAEHETPFCFCGEYMSTVAKPDGIWLECSTLQTQDPARIGRLLAALTAGGHIRSLIVDTVRDAA